MMWAIQKSTGIIEGWHGDGNFARTSLMFSLWKTQGLHIEPWREDVHLGAVQDQGRLCVSVSADKPWSGKLYFDRPRHRLHMKLPMDYPRINQFPEWFTVDPLQTYTVGDLASPAAKTYAGKKLLSGLSIELTAGEERRIVASINK